MHRGVMVMVMVLEQAKGTVKETVKEAMEWQMGGNTKVRCLGLGSLGPSNNLLLCNPTR